MKRIVSYINRKEGKLFMATLGKIIEAITAALNASPKGDFDPETSINYIQFPLVNEKTVCQPQVLYIGMTEGNFKPCKGCCVICYGQEKQESQNILFLPEETDSLTVYRAAENEIMCHIAMNNKKDELFNALKGDTGVQGILNIANSYLGNPVVVVDTSLSILCSSPKHNNAFDFVIQNNKQYMKPESVKSMHEERLIERIEESPVPFTTYREKLQTQMMYCRIQVQKLMTGYLCILAQNHPFKDEDMEFVQTLSDILSVEMQKNKFFLEKRGLKYEYFLADLIEGRFESAAFVHERLVQIGWTERKYYDISSIAFEDHSQAHLNQQYLIEQLVTILPGTMAFLYRSNLVLLRAMNADQSLDEGVRLKLNDFLNFNRMKIAVSYRFTNLLEAPLYYRQTIQLLILMAEQQFGKIFLFEDYCVQSLLMTKYSFAETKSFIHPDIKYLMEYDRKSNTEYYATLCAYLESNRSAPRAAETLHIHKTTFFYRFQKMQELLNKDFSDRNLLFEYELSVRLQSCMDR